MSDDIKPVKVSVDWSNLKWPTRKRKVNKTTVKTYAVGAAGWVQIADTEPRRMRMTVRPIDNAVALTLDAPTNTPDTSSATAAPQGAYLPANTTGAPECFYGPDAMYLNSLGTATRVVVIKEYE